MMIQQGLIIGSGQTTYGLSVVVVATSRTLAQAVDEAKVAPRSAAEFLGLSAYRVGLARDASFTARVICSKSQAVPPNS